MKCFLCNLQFETIIQLENHYLNFHKVNPDNQFFKKLLAVTTGKKNNNYLFQKCLRCSELLPTTEFKAVHEFVKHYSDGNQELAENKPISVESNSLFTKYSINVKNFGEFYDFYDPQKVIHDFLSNVKAKFQTENDFTVIKGSFVIENIQRSGVDDILPILDTRYWSTETYTVNYFNQFLYYNLAEDYSKKVINNGLTGSSWNFNRFINLNLTAVKNQKLVV